MWGEWGCGSNYSSPRHEMEISGQLHTMAALLQEKHHPIPLIRRLVDARADLDALRTENSGVPDGVRTDSSSSQSEYRLSHSDFTLFL
jgi:hypothetical protein